MVKLQQDEIETHGTNHWTILFISVSDKMAFKVIYVVTLVDLIYRPHDNLPIATVDIADIHQAL